MYGIGFVAGFIMMLTYGISMVKRGIKNQSDKDSITGILCVIVCAAMVLMAVAGKLSR